MSVWRRNPGYKPEWLDDNEIIEARDITGNERLILKAFAFIWEFGQGTWDIYEFRLLNDEPDQDDSYHLSSEKPSEIVAQSDLEACLRHIKKCIGSNELALVISNNEFMIEYRDSMYTCKDEVTAVELIDMFVTAEIYHVD